MLLCSLCSLLLTGAHWSRVLLTHSSLLCLLFVLTLSNASGTCFSPPGRSCRHPLPLPGRDQPPLSNHRRDSSRSRVSACSLSLCSLCSLLLAHSCSLVLTGAHWSRVSAYSLGVCLLTRRTHLVLALLRLEEAVATRSPCQHDQPPLSNRRRDSSRSRVSACSSIRAGAGCLLAQCLLNACSMLRAVLGILVPEHAKPHRENGDLVILAKCGRKMDFTGQIQ